MPVRGVLVLAGPPCAGKSSVGSLLAAGLPGSVFLEVDAVFSLILPRSDRNRRDRMLAYDAAHALVRTIVGRGLMVILECTYSRAQQRESLAAAMAELHEVPLWVAEFRVTPDEAARRFAQRQQATDLDEQDRKSTRLN